MVSSLAKYWFAGVHGAGLHDATRRGVGWMTRKA